MKFLKRWSHINFVAIGRAVKKEFMYKCRLLFVLIKNDKCGAGEWRDSENLRYYTVEWVLHTQICLAKFGKDRSCHPCEQEPIREEHANAIGVCNNCPPLKEVINSPTPQPARDPEAWVGGGLVTRQQLHSARVSGCDARVSIRQDVLPWDLARTQITYYLPFFQFIAQTANDEYLHAKNALIDCISFSVQGT